MAEAPRLTRGERGPVGDRGPLGPDGPRGYEGHPGETGATGQVGHVDIPTSVWWKLIVLPVAAAFIVAAVMSFLTTKIVSGHVRQAAYAAQVRGCDRGVLDRVSDIRALYASQHSNFVVSTDMALTAKTRHARREEANQQLDAVWDKESRVPRRYRITRQGKKLPQFDCARLFPKP